MSSESSAVAVVRRLYASGMAPEVTAEVMAADLVWDISPGFPHGGVYGGWESVGRDFFGKLAPSYESFSAQPEEFFLAGGDRVVVTGHYRAVAVSGSVADVRFVHLWTVRAGKITRLWQVADSHVARELAR